MRIESENQQVYFSTSAREVEVRFCYSLTEVLIFRMGVVYLILTMETNMLSIYSILLKSSDPQVSKQTQQCAPYELYIPFIYASLAKNYNISYAQFKKKLLQHFAFQCLGTIKSNNI